MTPEQFTKAVRRTVLSQKNYNKIFCIGFNKTGSTTLETILRLYGFNLPNQLEQETRLTTSCYSTNYTEFSNFVSHYDAFQDMPFAKEQIYVVADALFPGSKFILTERDSEAWFRSMTSFKEKIYNLDDAQKLTENDLLEKFTYLYPGYAHQLHSRILTNFVGDTPVTDWDKLYDKQYYTNHYESRNNQIKRYFMNSMEKLLIIDVTKEKTTKKICEFLNIPEQFVIDMPHANKT